MDLVNELESLIEKLNISVKQVRISGEEYARADRDYKVALSETLVMLEAEGRPVSNLIYIARGYKKVADAKYQQICKEAIYKANLESIQSLKLQIKIVENELDREYRG